MLLILDGLVLSLRHKSRVMVQRAVAITGLTERSSPLFPFAKSYHDNSGWLLSDRYMLIYTYT